MERNINQGYHPKAAEFISGYHSSVIAEVSEAVQNNAVTVVGMAQNPVVKKARKILKEQGIDYKYLEYGSYFSAWKPRLMIKIWSGWPTFPQIFVQGKCLGGFNDLNAAIEDGSFEQLLATQRSDHE